MTTATHAAILPITDPATGQSLGEVRAATPAEAREAVERARRAAPAWAARPARERARALHALADALLARREEVARAIVRSTGKPIAEAYTAEIFPVALLLRYFARNAHRMLRPEKIGLGPFTLFGRRSLIEHRPYGVMLVISPWNYPFSIAMGELAIALVAGNTVVLKPSEFTPLVGEWARKLVEEIDLPPGAVEIVQGRGDVGAALIDARPDKVIFTGSTATGRKIMEAAARHPVPVVLELGGKDPMIVLDDADLDAATDGALWGSFLNSGQTCASVERLYVHAGIAGEFVHRFVEKARRLRQGDPMDPKTDLGSLTTAAQLAKVETLVADAVGKGAKVETGGKRRDDLGPLFYAPTVLTGVTAEMKLCRDEVFGPVVWVAPFADEDDAVAQANDSPYGLTASVWSRDLKRAGRVARRLHTGTVMINECACTHGLGETPWGGVGDTGFGRTHGRHGLMEMVQPLHIHTNRKSAERSLWWFPYSDLSVRLTNYLADALAGRGWARVRGWASFLKEFRRDFLKPTQGEPPRP